MASYTRGPSGRWKVRYRTESGQEVSRTFDRKLDGQRWVEARVPIDGSDRARRGLAVRRRECAPQPAAPSPPRRCALYRHYDAAGRLLYVGITVGLRGRTNGHARSARWAEFATSATAQWYPDVDAARAAELEAIRVEEPIFNLAGSVGQSEREADYLAERSAAPCASGKPR